MRHFLPLIVLLGLWCHLTQTQAQTTQIAVFISITDQANAPVPNQPFSLDVVGNQSGLINTFNASTDTNGEYEDSLFISPPQNGFLLLSTLDCQGLQVADTLTFNDSAFQWKFLNLSICTSSGPSCQADFTANSNNLNVSFANQSTSIPTAQYQWDFGDGNGSGQTSPTHTYATPGTYAVSLIQTDTAQNCADTMIQTITVCTAAFTFDTTGLTVDFQPTDTSAFSYNWDFGDGNTSQQVAPSHTYAQPGIYGIVLQTVGSGGCTATAFDSVAVGAGTQFCAANFSVSINGPTVSFFNQSSGTNLSYDWDFGDGTNSTATNPAKTYNAPGTYTVCLIVSNPTGCSDTLCQPVVTTAGNCQADFFPFALGGTSYIFFNQSFLPPGDTLTAVLWDFGDGASSTVPDTVSHTYASGGTYTVSLFIQTSSGCTDTTTQQITVFPTTPCFASFTTTPQGGTTVSFISTGAGASYFWDFDDNGNTSTAVNPTYTFSSPGSYDVTLTVQDSSCTDSFTQTVTVSGGPVGCDADFFPLPLGGNTFQFLLTTPPAPTAVLNWTILDSLNNVLYDTTELGAATLHYTFPGVGTYQVRLSLTDSAAACSDTATLTIPVTGPTPCTADFTWSSLGGNSYQFTNLSNASSSAGYAWSFGDGDTSTAVSPTHTYGGPGPWTVSLAVVDPSTGCFDSVSYQVGGSGSNAYQISGAVLTDSMMPVFDGMVYLIQYDSAAATLNVVDSTMVLGSFYNFTGVLPGDYLVKAALLPASPQYANYLPTYLGDEFFWYDATGTIVTNSNVVNPDINLIAGNNPGGPAFIGGSVAAGANKTTGEPASGVSVLLFNAQEEAVEHVKTDENGEFGFDNLPYGTYHLYVDLLDHYSERHTITVTPDNPSSNAALFEIIGSNIVATDVARPVLAEEIRAYPNPTRERLQVELTLLQAAPVQLRLVDQMGQTLMQRNLGQRQGMVEQTLAVDQLPAGLYLLTVQAGEQQRSQRIVVER